MELSVRIDVPKFAWLQPGLARRILQQEMGHGVQQVEERILAAAQRNAPVDRGMLRSKLVIRPSRPGAGDVLVHSVVASGPETPYARGIEQGTKPHWISGDDFEGLKGWAKRKLGNANIAFAVRHSIAKKGTAAQPFLAPASREVEPQVPIIMNGYAAIAAQRLGGLG